jgi:hypothetical protein
VHDVSALETIPEDNLISWAAFHSNEEEDREWQVSTSSLLPLFPDDSKSAAMMCHGMNVVQKAVNHINPGQTPVITADQPLFALAKHIQWALPNDYGEDKFVVMLGGFHTEVAALK